MKHNAHPAVALERDSSRRVSTDSAATDGARRGQFPGAIGGDFSATATKNRSGELHDSPRRTAAGRHRRPVEYDGPRPELRDTVRNRGSEIHRTDIPHRHLYIILIHIFIHIRTHGEPAKFAAVGSESSGSFLFTGGGRHRGIRKHDTDDTGRDGRSVP